MRSDICYLLLAGTPLQFTEVALNFTPCTHSTWIHRYSIFYKPAHDILAASLAYREADIEPVSRKHTRCAVVCLVTQSPSPTNILDGLWEGGWWSAYFSASHFWLLLPHPIPEISPPFFRFKLQKPEVCAGFFYSYHDIGAECGSAGSAD